MTTNQSYIQSLVKKARKNDQKAFEILLNTFWSDIYRFQLSKNKDVDDAEDITIKTFSKAFEKIDTYKSQYEFKKWLLTISNNLFIDHFRKRKAHIISIHKKEAKAHTIFDETPTIEDQIIKEQNLTELLHYLKKLKPHYKEVIELRYFNELSYKEIAEKLNQPISNIKVKLLRAKKLLATIISDSK